MKSVTRQIAVDENLGGGRAVRSYKPLSRMVCNKCGYVQMTGDAIANGAWMNAGESRDGRGLDAETVSLVIVAIAVVCMGAFIGWGLFRVLGLWWRFLVSVGATIVIGWLHRFLTVALDDHPGWTLMMLMLPVLAAVVWWWPLTFLALGWKLLLTVGMLLVAFMIGGIVDTLAGRT